uniref:Putative secreted protein n=1 Tax=Anopheles darlingi TaxID=43151 RepID=A0A2M4D852_ANODA
MYRSIVAIPLSVCRLLALHGILSLSSSLAVFVTDHGERNADDGGGDRNNDRYEQLNVVVKNLRTMSPLY